MRTEVRAGETVPVVAARMGVGTSAAYLWIKAAPEASEPTFAKLMRALPVSSSMVLEVGRVRVRVDPRVNSEKAERGATTHPFDFLGCSIQRGLVQPNKTARERVIDRVRVTLRQAEVQWGSPTTAHKKHATLGRLLYDLGNMLRGWRDSFSFCTNASVFRHVDDVIDAELDAALARLGRRLRNGSKAHRRLLLGLPVLSMSARE